MNPSEISAELIDTFQNGSKKLLCTTHGGTIDLPTRVGVEQASYCAGSLVLTNGRDEAIVGPIHPNGALDLAEQVLDGDDRVITESQTLLILACSVIGLTLAMTPETPTSPDHEEAAGV